MQMTRQEQAMRSRRKIIDTTMTLIEEKGYAGVTIKDICEKAELSIGAFYHHFSNIAEVLFSYYNQFDANLEEGIKERNFSGWMEKADFLCRSYLELTLQHGWKTSSAVISTQFQIEDKYLYREERFLNQMLTAAIDEGKRCGDIKSSEDSTELCRWVLRTVRGAIFDWVMHDGKTDLLAAGIHDYTAVFGGMMK